MRVEGVGAVALVTSVLVLAATPARADGPVLPIADFDYGQNRVGGFHGSFHRLPSTARTLRVGGGHRPNGYALRVTATRAADGFAGAFVSFYDHRAATRTYVDGEPYDVLSFWVRGAIGGEELTVRIADEQWLARDDAFTVGPIRDFLPAGVTTSWQQVVVPLAPLPLDLRRLAALSLSFDVAGSYTVYVDDVSLQSHPGDTLPLLSGPLPRPPGRAVWQWDSRQVVADPHARAELLDFLLRDGIRRVWMLLPHTDADGNFVDGVTSLSLNRDALREFLAAAHQHGVAIEVLDGAPELALAANHARALALVDAVAAFNAAAPAGQGFDGVHLDIEPYLLPGWETAATREAILRAYLDLTVESQRRLAAAGIAFGVDIPYWWQDAAAAGVTYGGARKAAAFHCIDRFDAVGIMNYQRDADGEGGMIARGTGLLAYADAGGRARVYMGTETPAAGDSLSAAGFLWEAALAEGDFRRFSSFAGTALHHYASYRQLLAAPSGTEGGQERGQHAVERGRVLQRGEVPDAGQDLEPAPGHAAVDRLRVRHGGERVLAAADDQRRDRDLPQRRARVRARRQPR